MKHGPNFQSWRDLLIFRLDKLFLKMPHDPPHETI